MSSTGKETDFRKYLNAAVRGLRHLLLHNGWLKAIAIVISVVLWAGLISQDENITRDKTFQNVSVSVTGSDTMKNNGYIVVSDLNEILNDVSIVAAVPQKQYEKAEASAYNVRLDLSRVNGTGEQEIKLQSTNSSTFGKVTSTNPASVTVQVEEYIVRPRIPVSVTVEGTPPEGWYLPQPTVDYSLIAVSGPKSLVQDISRARAFINTDDIEWKEGTVVTSSKILLYDRTGGVVQSPLLSMTNSSMTIDSVLIELNILPSESFETGDLIQTTGAVAKGYTVKEIRVSPEVVSVAARQEVLDQLTDLSIDRNTVNISNLSETTVFQLKVQKPSDDAILSNDTITVTVEIGPEEP